jgi:M6 family metalloprotease-like protein
MMFFAKPAHSFFFSAAIALSIAALSAQNTNPASERARQLNNDLLRIHSEMQQISPDEWRAFREEAAPALEQRFAALSDMIKRNPREALKYAFSPELADDLAAKFPQALSHIERHGTWQGPVERWAIDYADGKSSREMLMMKAGQQTFEVHFAGPEPAGLKSGDVLEVTGVQVGSMLLASSGTVESPESLTRASRPPRDQSASIDPRFSAMATTSTSTTSACSNTGVQNTAVLLVTFPGTTLPTTVTNTSLQNIFFGTAGHSMNGYLQEVSYGQTSAAGNVFGPYTLTGTYTSCSDLAGTVLNDAIAAAIAGGADLSKYTRIFLVFPDVLGCGWSAEACSGCSTTTSSGTFNATHDYIAAGMINSNGVINSNDTGVFLASNVIGHNFGLGYAQLRAYGTQPLGALTDPGTITTFGDHFSVMATNNLGHYAAPQKQMIGWLNASQVQTVTTSGTYTISPLETNQAGVKALQVQRGSGNTGYNLWIEYRQGIGYDSTLSSVNPQVFSGATIHYQDSTTSSNSQLLDYTAPATYYDNPDLAVGSTWTDTYSNLSITVQSATASGLTVNINYGAMPCTHSNPSVSVSPANPSVYAGSSVSYTISVTNNDTAVCSAATFNLDSGQQSGWTGTFSTASLTISPGQSASATLTEAPPTGTVAGTYGVSASATNGTYSGSGTANCTVLSAPTLAITVSVPSSTYTRRNTVSITATVLKGGSPVSGARVTFTLKTPAGSTTTQTATTSSNGTANWSYKLNQKSPVGTYSVSAQTTVSSTQATSNTATFAVQ